MVEKLLLHIKIKKQNLRLAFKPALLFVAAWLFLPGGIVRSMLFILCALILYNPLEGMSGFSLFLVGIWAMIEFAPIMPFSFLVPLCAFGLMICARIMQRKASFHKLRYIMTGYITLVTYAVFYAFFAEQIGFLFFLILVALLVFGFMKQVFPLLSHERRFASLIIILMCAQGVVLMDVLPISVAYRALIMTIILVFVFDCVYMALQKTIVRERLLLHGAGATFLIVFLFQMARWLPF